MKPLQPVNTNHESLGRVIRRLKSQSSRNSSSTAISKSSTSSKLQKFNRIYSKYESGRISNQNFKTKLQDINIQISLNPDPVIQSSINTYSQIVKSSKLNSRRNTEFYATEKAKPLIRSTDLTTNWDENSRNFYGKSSGKQTGVNVSDYVKKFISGDLSGEELKSKLSSLKIPISDRLEKHINEQGRSGTVPFYEIARELHVNLR